MALLFLACESDELLPFTRDVIKPIAKAEIPKTKIKIGNTPANNPPSKAPSAPVFPRIIIPNLMNSRLLTPLLPGRHPLPLDILPSHFFKTTYYITSYKQLVSRKQGVQLVNFI